MQTLNNIAVIGASGAIGNAFFSLLKEKYPQATIHAFSRNSDQKIDYQDEDSIESAANIASEKQPLDLVIVCTGILHDDTVAPEKSLKELSAEKFHHLFEINTIAPAMIAKYFVPKLNKKEQSVFAVLSARVGSISDNQLGGWYAYRASKAALNMIIKTTAIEVARFNKKAAVIGLHPGTVDSALSKPFQSNVPDDQLFSPAKAASYLLNVILERSPQDTGRCFAWDGEEISP